MPDLNQIPNNEVSSTHPVAPCLRDNLTAYLDKYTASEKTRLKKTIHAFLHHINSSDDKFSVNNSEALSVAIKSWKEHYYLSSKTNLRTKEDYFCSFLKYIRHLISKDILPKILLPAVKKDITSAQQLMQIPILATKKNSSDFVFYCLTDDGKKGPPHELQILSTYGDKGNDIARVFKNLQIGKAYSTQARRKSVFIGYFKFLKQNFKDIDLTNQALVAESIYSYHRSLYLLRGESSISSVNDNWRSFTNIGSIMMQNKLLPTIIFPIPFRKADKFSRQFRKNNKLLSMSLKNIERFDKSGKKIESAYKLASEELDENFLAALERDECYVYDQIRSAAIQEVKKSIKDFQFGQKLIGQCNINYLRETYKNTGKLVDPNERCGSGQSLSFFSPKHPEGLINVLGWIWYEHYGLTLQRSFPGFDQIDNYGGILQIKRYLGLCSENALPFFIVILGETAMNVESLEKVKIKNKNNKNIFLVPSENGEYANFSARKPRAKIIITKLIKVNSKTEINAYLCLSAVHEMTARYRQVNKCNDLWIGPYSANTPSHISSTSFKNHFKKFIKRHKKLKELDSNYLNRSRIRVSAGIIEWFRTGGDPIAVAKKLGNSPTTALKHYIPIELQEILYRREIRRFQNLLIIAASTDHTLTGKALGEMTTDDVTKLIKKICNDKNIKNGSLYKHMFPNDNKKSNDKMKINFVLSEKNVALLKVLADYIDEQKLAFPTDIQMTDLFCDQPLSYWIELWTAVKFTLRNSSDRGHKKVYVNGIALSEKLYDSIEFSFISSDKNNHV